MSKTERIILIIEIIITSLFATGFLIMAGFGLYLLFR